MGPKVNQLDWIQLKMTIQQIPTAVEIHQMEGKLDLKVGWLVGFPPPTIVGAPTGTTLLSSLI